MNKVNRVLNHRAKNITAAAFILAGTAFLSALLGLLRDRLLAGRFGAGDELDVYFAAFRIPDFIAYVLILGAVSAALIPIFGEYLAKSKKDAWEFAGSFLGLLLVFLIAAALLCLIFAPQLIRLIAPGFSLQKQIEAALLTRIMLLSPILLGLSNAISGILRVFRRFFLTSLAPLLYNFGIILGILFFVPLFGLRGLAWGVVLGAGLHLLIQLPLLFQLGFRFKKKFFPVHPGVLRTLKLTIPRALGLAATQINLIVITAIGSTLAVGSVAVFNLAQNLSNLPVTFIGISFATAAFPFLAMALAQKNKEKFSQRLSSVFSQILFLVLPAACLLFLLRAQLTRVILGVGKFGWVDTRLTAAILGVLSFSIIFQSINLLLAKAFYASQNTKIPALATVAAVAVNIALCFLFVWLLGFANFFQETLVNVLDLQNLKNIAVLGLPLAVLLSAFFQSVLLFGFFQKKIAKLNLPEIFKSSQKIVGAALISIFLVLVSLRVLASFLNLKTFLGVFLQGFGAGLVGIFVYIYFSLRLKSKELKDISLSLFKKS